MPDTATALKGAKAAGRLTLGHTVKKLEEYLFDWVLYGTVVAWCTYTFGVYDGSIMAFVLMTPLALFVNTLWLAFYNWSKVDWFGLEAVREFEEAARKGGRIARTAYALLKAGKVPAFFVLSIFGDPFLTIVYLRKKDSSYTKLSTRDRYVLIASALVSNAYWTLRWTVLIEIVKYVWEWTEPYRAIFMTTDAYRILHSLW